MSIFAELKRRNVFRVGVAYLVIAWLLMQVTDTLVPALHLPSWIITAAALFLIIGFPLALVFAWAFELTPEGLKREADVELTASISQKTGRKLDYVIIGALVLALGYLAYDKFLLAPQRDAALVENTKHNFQRQTATEANLRKSIAVLPFLNVSDDPSNEYFSDGLSEEILNLLAKIQNLKVIARTSSFAFKGKNEDVRTIGDALGVKTLLEGSVRKAGNRVRITAQLIQVADGAHIWSETYDRTLTDIFAVQDDVAAAIIDALEIHVSANPTRGRPTENTEAYALFLKARASSNTDHLRDTERFLLQAIALDPEFAEAYEMLASNYWSQGGITLESAAAQKLMGEAASKALVIDPDLAYAKALSQVGNPDSYSFLGEIEAFEQAARKEPRNTAVFDSLVYNLLEAGYIQEAIGVAEQYVELDPLSSVAHVRMFETLYAAGRTSEAVAALELADRLGNDYTKMTIGDVNLVENQTVAAIENWETWVQQQDFSFEYPIREIATGALDPTTGQAYLDHRIPQFLATAPKEEAQGLQLDTTKWYLLFGFLDRYFDAILEIELTDKSWTDADYFVYTGTIFRRLGFTRHPRYLDVVESIGIIDVWQQRGPPDFCKKVRDEWVCE